MSSPAADYLRHILEEVDYLSARSKGLASEEFLQDETLRRAFVRSLEIIGEAAKKIPPEFTDRHPQIDETHHHDKKEHPPHMFIEP